MVILKLVSGFFLVLAALVIQEFFKYESCSFFSSQEVRAQEIDIEAIDRERVRRRLQEAHGDFNYLVPAEWKIVSKGKIDHWRWAKKWECSPDAVLKCQEWVPWAFRWWVQDRNWIKKSEPVRMLNFEVGRARINESRLNRSSVLVENPTSETSPELSVQPGADEDLEHAKSILNRQERASEVWEWRLSDGAVAQIAISSKTQWVERIQVGEWVEYIEWERKPKLKFPIISRVLVETPSERVLFIRIDPPEKSVKKAN